MVRILDGLHFYAVLFFYLLLTNSKKMNSQICCSPSAFPDYIIQCSDVITIHALNLDPLIDYRVRILSPIFGTIEVDATTNSDGYLEIECSDLPAGFLNAHSGSFQFSVYNVPDDPNDQSDSCDPIKLLLAKYYESVSIDVRPGTLVKSKIACPALPTGGE